MNRRQAKKAYKKKYGYNPPNFTKKINRAITNMNITIQRIIPVIQDFFSNIHQTIQETEKNIKTMSDEDFNKIMRSEDFDAKTKALAWRIRMTHSEEANNG